MKYIAPEKEAGLHGKSLRRYWPNVGWNYNTVPCKIVYSSNTYGCV